jgi:hypothetical protein
VEKYADNTEHFASDFARIGDYAGVDGADANSKAARETWPKQERAQEKEDLPGANRPAGLVAA